MAGEKKIALAGLHTYGEGCKRRSRKYYKVVISDADKKLSKDEEMS